MASSKKRNSEAANLEESDSSSAKRLTRSAVSGQVSEPGSLLANQAASNSSVSLIVGSESESPESDQDSSWSPISSQTSQVSKLQNTQKSQSILKKKKTVEKPERKRRIFANFDREKNVATMTDLDDSFSLSEGDEIPILSGGAVGQGEEGEHLANIKNSNTRNAIVAILAGMNKKDERTNFKLKKIEERSEEGKGRERKNADRTEHKV